MKGSGETGPSFQPSAHRLSACLDKKVNDGSLLRDITSYHLLNLYHTLYYEDINTITHFQIKHRHKILLSYLIYQIHKIINFLINKN